MIGGTTGAVQIDERSKEGVGVPRHSVQFAPGRPPPRVGHPRVRPSRYAWEGQTRFMSRDRLSDGRDVSHELQIAPAAGSTSASPLGYSASFTSAPAVHEPRPTHRAIIEALLTAGADVNEAEYPSGDAEVDRLLSDLELVADARGRPIAVWT